MKNTLLILSLIFLISCHNHETDNAYKPYPVQLEEVFINQECDCNGYYAFTETWSDTPYNLDTLPSLNANESYRLQRPNDRAVIVKGAFEDTCRGSVRVKNTEMKFNRKFFAFYINIHLVN